MLVTQTEIDAVNYILSAIGSSPVTTLEGDMDIDVVNARRLIEKVSRDIQRRGWDFNTATRILSPEQGTKHIPWARSSISLHAADGSTLVKRGQRLYDMTRGSDEFDNPVTVTLIEGVDYDDLPDAFKTYVTAKAAVDFHARYFGDAAISEDLQMDLNLAYQDIVQYDMEMQPLNMLQVAAATPVLERS